MGTLKFIDLFCGIGGFRLAIERAFQNTEYQVECVFSSDIDSSARETYEANFGDIPSGDITKISEYNIPDFDVLLAGFPCQPFSIIGDGMGFDDIRGTLFFDIARILKEKRPRAFVLENVKQLVSHDEGKSLKRIIRTLEKMGYAVDFRVLNALDYGLPQKRERVFIVGILDGGFFSWPAKLAKYTPLSKILEKDVDPKFYASERITQKRHAQHVAQHHPSIWHENKAGNICSYPYSCALRAGASYNYLLVNGDRRLTPREMLRLQGFPDTFKVVVSDGEIRKQAGNSLPVNAAAAVLKSLAEIFAEQEFEYA